MRPLTDLPVGYATLGDGAPGPPEMLALLRPEGSITFANDALCRCYGLTPEQVVGRPFVALVDREDRARVEIELSTLSPAKRGVVTEARALLDDNQRRWLRWTHLGIFDHSGLLLEIHSFGRDVTHDRKVEEDSARLAAIVAGAEDAILSKTLQGIITSWNPAAEAMFGYSAAEAVGQSITLIIPPDRLHEESEILARVQAGVRTEHFQTDRLHKDGRLLPISVNVSPVRDTHGRIIGASKIARDMSDQRRAQEKLQASVRSLEALYRLVHLIGQANDRQEVYEAALEAITAAMGTDRASVLIFDATGVMRFVAWRGLSDQYRQALEGHSPWKPDTRNPLPIPVEDVLSDPSMAGVRDEIVREGIRALAFVPLVYQDRLLGKFMVYFTRPRAFTPEEFRLAETIGHHVGFGLARVDAEAAAAEALEHEQSARTDADVARREAEQASRAKDEFLAMLAHELRNPLGVIVHGVALLGTEDAVALDREKIVSMIERQSRHLARLLDDLLDVARISSGRIQLETQPVDLRTVVTLAMEAQRVRIAAKEQKVTVSLPTLAVTVLGDAVRLQQVVGNLVNNASKYTPRRGSIWVEVEAAGAEGVLRVRDTGAGIPPDRLGSIFDLFVQANPTLARTEGGLGVGLTLVRRIVELHGGQVDGNSAGLGKGAEFVMRLPMAQADENRVAPSAPSPQASAMRILIVEDHEDGREALATVLRANGHEVYEASTGKEGLALAEARRPNVILLDIGLPDLDGYAVAQALRARFGDGVHLVALTGYGQPNDRDRSHKAGFEAHLVKPVDSKAILGTLASLVG